MKEKNSQEETINLNQEGLALLAEGKHSQALELFDRLTKLDPENATYHNNKGVALYKLGRYIDAIPCFEEAIKLNPKNAIYYHNKVDTLCHLGRSEEAVKYGYNIAKQYSGEPLICNKLVEIFMKKGMYAVVADIRKVQQTSLNTEEKELENLQIKILQQTQEKQHFLKQLEEAKKVESSKLEETEQAEKLLSQVKETLKCDIEPYIAASEELKQTTHDMEVAEANLSRINEILKFDIDAYLSGEISELPDFS